MGQREGANIWHSVARARKHPALLRRFFTLRFWRGPGRAYFWHDSFGRYIAQLLRCPIRGHKLCDIDDGSGEMRMHCFKCEQDLPMPRESDWYNWQYRKGHTNGYTLGLKHGKKAHEESKKQIPRSPLATALQMDRPEHLTQKPTEVPPPPVVGPRQGCPVSNADGSGIY